MIDLRDIPETMLDGRIKGLPGGLAPLPLHDVGSQGWNIHAEDLPLPQMLLKQSAVAHNLDTMRQFCAQCDVSIAPHGKTTMSPQLFKQQLDAGAWGMTAATVEQIQVYRHYGVPRIFMANQLVGKQNIRFIVEELNRDASFDFYCLVDSPHQVEQLAAAAREAGLEQRLQVLFEIGTPGGRSGCRTIEDLTATATAVQAGGDVLQAAGVEGHEGIIDDAPEAVLQRIDQFLQFVCTGLRALDPALFAEREEILLVAGGSGYFDRVVDIFQNVSVAKPVRIVLCSGCYITHDHELYDGYIKQIIKRGWQHTLLPALEVWAYVQSLPEPGIAILGAGKRDCAFDFKLPIPIKGWRPGYGELSLSDCEIYDLNDQHAYMRFAGKLDLQVGDMVALGISHPCNAFDKWRFIPIVSDSYDVDDAVLTFF